MKARCEELKLQPRGTRGESGGQTGITYDISNKHRLGYSEVHFFTFKETSILKVGLSYPKGQLISKWLFGVFNYPNKLESFCCKKSPNQEIGLGSFWE